LALANQLPEGYLGETFNEGIPSALIYTENTLRVLIFLLPIFLQLNIKTAKQKQGLTLFVVGTLIYFSSWLILILYPNSAWSTSHIGFMAPAYTPILWLSGIALIGKHPRISPRATQFSYLIISFLFVVVHSYHSYLAYHNFY
jgi:hypothetical protein